MQLVTTDTKRSDLVKGIARQCARYLNDFAEQFNIRAIFFVVFRKSGPEVAFAQNEFWFGRLRVVPKVINIGEDKPSSKGKRTGQVLIDPSDITAELKAKNVRVPSLQSIRYQR